MSMAGKAGDRDYLSESGTSKFHAAEIYFTRNTTIVCSPFNDPAVHKKWRE